MFPDKFDRYRMVGYIMRQLRNEKRLNQDQLAILSLSHQPVNTKGKPIPMRTMQGRISEIETPRHLDAQASKGQSAMARYMFLFVASEGLGLSQTETNSLLWLLENDDYSPLTRQELNALPKLKSQTPRHYKPTNLHRQSLVLLERAVKIGVKLDGVTKKQGKDKDPDKDSENPGKRSKSVERMLTGWEEEHQVQFREQLLEVEDNPGQRLLISKYPSLLTFPGDLFTRQNRKTTSLSPLAQAKIKELTNRRRIVFTDKVRQYGERCIHSKESLTRYVSRDFRHFLTVEERRAHVTLVADLLGRYPRFEVALAPTEPEMEFMIKCGQAASLRGTARDVIGPESVICGPLYIFWDDPTTVYGFMLDFEKAWEKIPASCRNKATVIAELREMVNASRRSYD